nr:hypothetical protein [Prevotella sp.]
MKKTILFVAFLSALIVTGCKNGKVNKAINSVNEDSLAVDHSDSTIYGVCGEGTGMSVMQLLTDDGDTLNILINDDSDESIVKGGTFVGDRMAVIASKQDGDWVATEVINVNSLIGKWTSIDKNFDILEGGEVKSNVKAESKPWTSWKIYNGKLVLNRDTFDIDDLGADSLYIENHDGIFTFKRQK